MHFGTIPGVKVLPRMHAFVVSAYIIWTFAKLVTRNDGNGGRGQFAFLIRQLLDGQEMDRRWRARK